MLNALTRGVSPTLANCELQELERAPLDIAKAIEQHSRYELCLEDLGARLIRLPADERFPDGVFVEDPAVVLDEIAIMNRMGAESRRGEGESIAAVLSDYRDLTSIVEPGTLEGGDVMRVERSLFIGASRRTNAEGIRQLRAVAWPLGYQVIAIPVRGCLHLKSACCYLGHETVLANRKWIDPALLGRYRILDVPEDEPRAANVLRVGNTLILPDAFPKTRELLKSAGFQVRTLDVSELAKAEGAVTCTCILFES